MRPVQHNNNRYNNCYMSASIQLLVGSCMYNFLRAENSVSSDFLEILTVHKKLTQSKSGAVPYNFKMTLGSSSVKRSVLGKILLYFTAMDYRNREYNDAGELLCTIIYKVFPENNIFCPFESILIVYSSI